MMSFIKNFAFAFLCISIIACKNEAKVEFEPVPVKIQRFDQSLNTLDIYAISDSVEYLMHKYPVFFPQYATNVIEIGFPGQPDFGKRLTAFQTNKTIHQVNKAVQEKFEDLSGVEAELANALGLFAHYFPEKQLPQFYSHVSGFNQSVITSEQLISVSLDKYLGRDEPMYDMLYPPVPEYMKYNMYEGKIASDMVYALGTTSYKMDAETKNLLSYMIYEGKLKYFVKSLMPHIHDTLLFGFKPEQLRFCVESEESMWVYLIEQKLLFETNEMTINKFINPAPFTKDFTKDSPGQALVWVGYKIVSLYMDRNDDVSLSQLMANSDFQRILNESRYNP